MLPTWMKKLWRQWKHPNGITLGLLNHLVQKQFPFFHVPHKRVFALKWWKYVIERIRTRYFIVFFALKSQKLLEDGKGSQALLYLNLCAPAMIEKMSRAPGRNERKALYYFFDRVQTALSNIVFKVITKETLTFSKAEINQIFALFQSSNQFEGLRVMKGLLDGKGAIISRENLAKVSFSMPDMKYMCIALMFIHQNDFRSALNTLRMVQVSALKNYAMYRAALIMKKGKGGPTFTKEIGEKIMQKLSRLGYKPAIDYHLEVLSARATTPLLILDAFNYANSVSQFNVLPPEYMSNLTTSLLSQIEQLRNVENKWRISYSREQARMINLLDPEGPIAPQEQLDAVTRCFGYVNSALKRASANLEEGEAIWAKLNCHKRQRNE
jgi:hypothetical protein